MKLIDRIELLSAVGNAFESDLANNRLDDLFFEVESQNPWFVKSFVALALTNLSKQLNKENLENWAADVKDSNKVKTIGLVPAGNIPLVGIHDILSIFISGHISLTKPSSKDKELLQYFTNTIKEIEPKSEKYFVTTDRLTAFDGVIATGSNNTNRYFEYYFGKYPNLLRKNRTSIGVINSDISDAEIDGLIHDIYMYFGLGCRSVSKLYIHKDFDLIRLLQAAGKYQWFENHNKFFNNYTYNKSIYLINKDSHFDTGFSIFKNDFSINSPISVVHYELFDSIDKIKSKISDLKNEIQVLVSHDLTIDEISSISFGSAQNTTLLDYADGKNTLKFLGGI